jgi:hypothetical protein
MSFGMLSGSLNPLVLFFKFISRYLYYSTRNIHNSVAASLLAPLGYNIVRSRDGSNGFTRYSGFHLDFNAEMGVFQILDGDLLGESFPGPSGPSR